MPFFFSQWMATIQRDLHLLWTRRYLWTGQVLWSVAIPSLLYLSTQSWTLKTPSPSWGTNPQEHFGALILGLVWMDALWSAAYAWSHSLWKFWRSGRLEALQAAGASPRFALLQQLSATLSASVLRSLLYLSLAIFVFGASFHWIHWSDLLFFGGLGLVQVLAISLISANLTLQLRQIEPLGRILWGASTVLTGAFIPLPTLPEQIQTLSPYLPLTLPLTGMRHTLLQTPTSPTLHDHWLLGLTAGFWTCLAAWNLYTLLKRGAEDGLHRYIGN